MDGFSSTTCTGGCAPCASIEALVLRLRAGAAFGSLGSAGFRGFLVFFSGSGAFGSFGFGFGPGFLRGCPDAVRPRGAGDVAFAGVGVLTFAGPTPTPALLTRTVDVGVPSGECGGELRLPGEDASFASIAAENRKYSNPSNLPDCVSKWIGSIRKSVYKQQIHLAQVRGAGSASRRVAERWQSGLANSTPKVADGAVSRRSSRTPKSMCSRVPGRGRTQREPVARRGTRSFNP